MLDVTQQICLSCHSTSHAFFCDACGCGHLAHTPPSIYMSKQADISAGAVAAARQGPAGVTAAFVFYRPQGPQQFGLF